MPQQNSRAIQPWKKGRKPSRQRKLKRILVLCEDEKSARDYLASFPFDSHTVIVECVGTGMNTDSLMEEAIKRKESAATAGNPFSEIGVVFDRDSFPAKKFNRAFDLARAHNDIHPYWANECFELWYLLHFVYRDTGISRHDLGKLLSGYLQDKYNKGDTTVYQKLRARLDGALRNARKLAVSQGSISPERENPSTNVHELIEKLLQFDPARLAAE
jgi:hypothetical protein